MLSAASRVGTLEELPLLFRQVQELLGLNMDAGAEGLLRPGRTAFLPETVGEVFDFDALRQAAGYEALVQELALAFLKMEAKGFGLRQQQQLCALAWKLLFADKPAPVRHPGRVGRGADGGLGPALPRRAQPGNIPRHL